MARILSSSFSFSFASTIILVDSMRMRSFSFSDSFSSSAFFCRSLFCSSMAFASASSLLILGFGAAGFSNGKSISSSSMCALSHSTAFSTPALSVLYKAFSARSSEKPMSITCCSNSLLTAALISSGFGSPTFLSSTAGGISTSSAFSMVTSPADIVIESRNSSVSLSMSASSACSDSQASAASKVFLSLVKCRALAALTRLWSFTSVRACSFFWSTESKNRSFFLEASSLRFWRSMRYCTVFSSHVFEDGSFCFILCISASVYAGRLVSTHTQTLESSGTSSKLAYAAPNASAWSDASCCEKNSRPSLTHLNGFVVMVIELTFYK
mmetsp:Transcript_65245/g.155861  ORF Transcript_65245/g.155861 Transcript_65245/m.155861 type:complete len:326 (-) Transcript_65245:62-1039(-)